MGEEGLISVARELIAGVDREKRWIMTIGLMGIIFSIIFAATMFAFDVLRPAGLLERGAMRSIWEISSLLFGICSVISTVAGIKVLYFLRSWQERYLHLKGAEKELEKKYFIAESQ
ncbi:MAG TPA: hypothetical protein VEH56_07440 [Candidatus Saccharimonadales bacterium]|nr:hypothetical protein [Candidatus Saccharimonadales bacterium]